MTLKDLNIAIAETENSDWYFTYQTVFNFPHINYNITLNGVPALYEYILKQIEGFEKAVSLPQELVAVKKRFVDAKATVLSLVSDKNSRNHSWDSNLTFLKNNSPLVFPFDAPETQFLIKVWIDQQVYYSGAFEFMTGNLNHTQNKNYWMGYMLAYEFLSKDFSAIAERKESEKKSIASTRADFQNKLGEAETHLAEYYAQAHQKFTDYSKSIDELKIEKENLYTGWFDKTSKAFTDFNSKSSKTIKDYEDLYKEKLKLEAPAKYWSERAAKLRKEGYWWLGGLISCILVSSIVLVWILGKTADGTIQKIFADTSIAVKWSIALVTLISFLAYGVRTFAKLTFSSFHLVRDAEEREQLTYVYLALQKEAKIDATERHLIMQSLFSRADSGLLKDDASPTMPGNIVDQMTRK